MQNQIDPRYTFTFTSDANPRYSRTVYWEDLYAFTYSDRTILVATRVVPHSSAQYALYETLKSGQQAPILNKILPEASGASTQRVLEGGEVSDIAQSVTDLVAGHTSSVPVAIVEEAERKYEAAVSEAMVRSGIEQGLNVFADPDEVQLGAGRADPSDVLHPLAGAESEDVAIINLSFKIDAALREQMRETLEQDVTAEGLVRFSDLEFDVRSRMYTNPKYLAFVKRLLDAPGSYVSPVVRDFLSFYATCLNAKIGHSVRDDDIDPAILQKRIEGILGHAKSAAYHTLNYHELTILGYLRDGEVKEDPSDPDSTGNSFKVDPTLDPGPLMLEEITESSSRDLARKFVSFVFNSHHHIKSIRFADEVESVDETAGGWFVRKTGRFGKAFASILPDEGDEVAIARLRNGVIIGFLCLIVIGAVIAGTVIVSSLLQME